MRTPRFLWLLPAAMLASGQVRADSAWVVPSCGSMNYSTSTTNSTTQDTTGALCTSGSTGGGGGGGTAATMYHLIAGASTNSVLIKNAAGSVVSVQLGGIGSAPAYLKFYDKASAPTCNTDAVKKTLIIPAAATAANGGGSNVSIAVGANFATGIGICVTAGIADTDNTAVAAAAYIVNIDYK